jgi:dipeptidyl aminopeptidase/acylaminoacyl peptidase
MTSINKHYPMKKRGTQKALIICFMIAVMIQPASAQQTSLPLPTDLLPRGRGLVPTIDLSPDGQWVAYTVQDRIKRKTDLDERYMVFTRNGTPTSALGCNIWATNTQTGEARNLTQSIGNNWGPSWSPNGTRLAFYSDRTGKPQLWIWNKSNNSLRSVSDVVVHQWSSYFDIPVWTPDSSRIIFKVLPEEVTVEQAANLTVIAGESSNKDDRFVGSTVTVYQFSPSSVASNPQNQEPTPQQSSDSNLFLGDLAVVDVSSGKLDRVAVGFRPCWYAVSPSGANLAFVTAGGSLPGHRSRRQFDVLVASLNAGSSIRVLAKNVETPALLFHEISWSPDGKSLSYVETENGRLGECYIVDLESGEPHKATDDPHPSFYNGYRAPLWNSSGESLYFLGDNAVWRISVKNRAINQVAMIPNKNLIEIVANSAGNRFWSEDDAHSMVVITRDDETKQAGFFKIDLTTGKSLKLLEESKQYSRPALFYLGASDDGRRIVYVAQDVKHPEDLWLSDLDFQKTRQLTRTNPEFSGYQMGTSRLIEWRSTNGERLRGALLLPPDYQAGKRYPLIVNVYGGDLGSNKVNEFGLGTFCDISQNMQLLATRGYVVLSPDAPLRVGTPMQDLAQTVLPAIDKTIELGIVDPERLGIMGRSYGGYSTLSLLVQTTRFKAAVSWAGVFNLFASYGLMTRDGLSGWTDWAEKSQGRMGGTPWEYRERYIENSPIFYLDRVQTPLMLGHGSIDLPTPSYHSEEVFVGLRRLGKQVVYNKYEGENHVIINYANQVDFWNRIIAWFDNHLKTNNPAITSAK